MFHSQPGYEDLLYFPISISMWISEPLKYEITLFLLVFHHALFIKMNSAELVIQYKYESRWIISRKKCIRDSDKKFLTVLNWSVRWTFINIDYWWLVIWKWFAKHGSDLAEICRLENFESFLSLWYSLFISLAILATWGLETELPIEYFHWQKWTCSSGTLEIFLNCRCIFANENIRL